MAKKNKISIFDSLHYSVRSNCKTLFEDKHYTEAVQNAGKEIERKIHETMDQYGIKTEAKGKELAMRVFSYSNSGKEKETVPLNYLSNSSEIDEQNGFCNLISGFLLAFRNPTSHPGHYIHDESDCYKILVLADLILSKIDARPSIEDFKYLQNIKKLKSPWREVYGELRSEIIKKGKDYQGYYEISEKINALYTSYQVFGKNFCELVVNKAGNMIDVYLDIEKNSKIDPKDLCIDKTGIGHLATGNTLFRINREIYDLGYLSGLIDKSLEKNSKDIKPE